MKGGSVDVALLKPQSTNSPFALLCGYADAATSLDVAQDTDVVAESSYLAFIAGGENFLLDVSNVRSVFSEEQMITRLPFSPSWLLGLSSVRSEIVSVVSFSDLWYQDQKVTSSTSEFHYILLDREGEGFMLRVDGLGGIRVIDVEPLHHQKRFIDGRYTAEGKSWQRINIRTLLETELVGQETQH